MQKTRPGQKNDRMSHKQRSDSFTIDNLQKETKEYEIHFSPIVIDKETEHFENVHLFEKLLPSLEGYADVFAYDYSAQIDDYSSWLDGHLKFAESIAPWLFAVMVNGEAMGLIWAYNWESNLKGDFSVEVGGMAMRETPGGVTEKTIRQFVKALFEETSVYIVRGDCAFDNRAARWAMMRSGMSHPETRRAWKIKGGSEITGIIYSVTRPEWEAANGRQ